MDNFLQIKHLYSRAGFGLRFEDLKLVQHASVNGAVHQLFNADADEPLDIVKQNADYSVLMKADIGAKKCFCNSSGRRKKT